MPILIQITVARDHPIKIHGVTAIWDLIPGRWKKKDACLLFVVSERSMLDKPQPYNGMGDGTAWEGKLKQRVVILTDKDLCARRRTTHGGTAV